MDKKVCAHTHANTYSGILFSHKEDENLAVCNYMDKIWGKYTNWNKPDRERQLLYNFISLTHL